MDGRQEADEMPQVCERAQDNQPTQASHPVLSTHPTNATKEQRPAPAHQVN